MKEFPITWKQALRAMANCYHDEKRDGKEDYDMFYAGSVKPFSGGIDEGYTAIGTNSELYIIFCGTNSWKDWFSNFDCTYEGADKSIKAHEGFFKGYLSCRYISDIAKDYDTVIVLGHSRGGDLATLCARDIAWKCKHTWRAIKKIWCVTAGSPKVYNEAGVKDWNATDINSIRFVYGSDIVPESPFGFQGYNCHVRGFVQLGKKGLFANPLDHYPLRYINAA